MPPATYNDIRSGRNEQYLSDSSILNSSYSLSGGFRDRRRRNCCHRCWVWAKDGFTIIGTCFIALTAAITVALAFQIRFGSPQVSPEGAVASDDGDCSEAGLEMIKLGGSAVDAAVASLLCLTVSHPHMVGIGGGGVMLVHDHLQMKSRVIDFLPDIPKRYSDQPSAVPIGGQSIGVPGFLQGLKYAHNKYGKLPWSKLFEPAIFKAKHGFVVSSSLEASLKSINRANIPSPIPRFPSANTFTNAFAATFFPPGGQQLSQGVIMRRRLYALLLERVALYDSKAVFHTDFSVEVFNMLKESQSSISIQELQQYEVLEYDAIHASYRNFTVFTAPQPFGGPQLLAALNLMDSTGVNATTSLPQFYKYMIQAVNATMPAFYRMAREPSHRANLTSELFSSTLGLSLQTLYPEFDEDYLTVPQGDVEPFRLLSDGLTDSYTLPSSFATQVSAIDTYDFYVSVVAGIGSPFGSQLMTPHGVLFNNMLAGVPPRTSLRARRQAPEDVDSGNVTSTDAPPNDDDSTNSTASTGSIKHLIDPPRGGRIRPLIPYAPFIVTDQHQVCGLRAICSSGSVSDSLQVLSQIIFQDLDVSSAVSQPRLAIDKNNPRLIRVHDLAATPSLPGEVRRYLKTRDYELGLLPLPYSSVNSISKVRDLITSHSDTRGGGVAARLGGDRIMKQVQSANKKPSVSKENKLNEPTEINKMVDTGTIEWNEGFNQQELRSPGQVRGSGLRTGDDITYPVVANDSKSSPTLAPKRPDTDAPPKTHGGNSKFMGDAEVFTKLEESGPQGSGKVIKGDKRGGMNDAPPQPVNGGRGSGDILVDQEPQENEPTHDNVFGGFTQFRSPSQVRQDDYNDADGADYVEAPIRIWDQQHNVFRGRVPPHTVFGGPPLQQHSQAVPRPSPPVHHVYVPGLGVVPAGAIRYPQEEHPVLAGSITDRYSRLPG